MPWFNKKKQAASKKGTRAIQQPW
ncbi:hypothetical protein CCACVL1_29218, partial [Corchorus capsularis]